ncbi:hypothetical protein YTPLAS18_19800 [Nitrospira sp.]|nr:hypothetical protein YTPLAS18_19800 [Nitrospira sp.]
MGWVAFGLVLVAVFTALTFPFDALNARIIKELARQSGATVEVDVRRPYRPLGIEWLGLRLSRGDHPVTIGRTTGVLSWIDALQGSPVVQVSMWTDERAINPAATAKITFTDWTFQGVAELQGMAERVDLPGTAGHPIKSGRANATFRFVGAGHSAHPLDGELRLEVNDLAVAQMTNQGVRVPEWSVNSLRITVQCSQQVCRIGEFLGTGPDGSLEATGQLLLGGTPRESRWDVAVTLTCSQALSQRAAAVGGFPLPVGTPLRAKLVGSLLQPRVAL